MDDRRFDSLAKAVASGASRRSVLKGILGLGGAALAGGVALPGDAGAARRPTPTPKPVKCPGNQVPAGGVCTCPGAAPYKCGPACCTGQPGDPPSPNHTECCDNACCHGTCYGEELCCPANPTAGGGAPIASVCANGDCCLLPNVCTDGVCGPPPPRCESNEDCAGCETCNQETGQCVPLCTGDTSQCCVNRAGVHCVPADATCCDGPEDCTEPCSYCNDEVWYCIDRCASDQCNDAFQCCAAGTTPCGNICCDDASQTCNGQGACDCIEGTIPCDGECLTGECCGTDNTLCAELGFDLQCVECAARDCSTVALDNSHCQVSGSQSDGWCSNGQCQACIPYRDSGCSNDNQCCEGSCLGGICDTQ